MILLFLHLLAFSSAQSTNSSHPKRGLVYIQTDHTSDYDIFTEPASPLTWYYNYSPWPGLTGWNASFAPMVHGTDDAAAAVDSIKAILNGSAGVPIARSASQTGNRITHVLTFNEPDGDTGSGGSDSTPEHAAQVYLDTIAPLRATPWNLQVGLPATTGSPRGLQWLEDFNTSCYALASSGRGCEFDFVAAHWYGDFAGLQSWLGTLHARYPDKLVWVTEFAVPGLDANATESFMDQALPYFDGLEYVQQYAWFGTFRNNAANEWTGDGVSMLDSHGRLTALGADYMGGKKGGFEQGMGGGAAGVRGSLSMVVIVSFVAGLLGCIM